MNAQNNSNKMISIHNGKQLLPYEYFLENSYISDGDIVIVSGTLVEGIGNVFSDIDVYVITDKLRIKSEITVENHHRVFTRDRTILRHDSDDEEVFLIQSIYPDTGIKVDFEYRTFTEVDELFNTIDSIFNYASENLILLTKCISARDECLVHRLLNGIIVYNENAYNKMMVRFDLQKYSYITYRWVASDFSVLMDIIGASDKGEYDRATELARINMITQMMGYLHIRGVTNTDPKWLLTYMNSNKQVDSNIKDEFISLYYFNNIVDGASSKIEYIKKTLDLVDTMYSASVRFLDECDLYPSGEYALKMLDRDLKEFADIDSFKELEYAYRARAYGDDAVSTKDQFSVYL